MAGQARELFNGSIPPGLLAQIMKAVDFSSWKSVWVGCSGTFSFERAVGRAYPGKPLYGNEIRIVCVLVHDIFDSPQIDRRWMTSSPQGAAPRRKARGRSNRTECRCGFAATWRPDDEVDAMLRHVAWWGDRVPHGRH